MDSLEGMKELKIFDSDVERETYIAKQSEEFRKVTMKVLMMQLALMTIIDTVAYGGAGIAIVYAILGAMDSGNPLSPAIAVFFSPLVCRILLTDEKLSDFLPRIDEWFYGRKKD